MNMKKTAILLACLLLCLLSFAAAADGLHPITASPTPVPYGSITGKITDSRTNEGLSGVTVSIGSQQVSTAANGTYTMQDVIPGSYTVNISKDLYNNETRSITVAPAGATTLDVAITRPATYRVTGVVSNAVDPSQKLSGVQVSCGALTAMTDTAGRYTMDLPGEGTHTLTFRVDGFYEATETVQARIFETVTANCSMSKSLAFNEVRVVLTWGRTPRDLDSHLIGVSPRNVEYHRFFGNRSSQNDNWMANLDVDDTNGDGPETTTFTIDASKRYVFYVHNYTGEAGMDVSNAKVVVYCGNRTPVTFTLPSGNPTRYWAVFEINGGELIPIGKYIPT